MSGLILVEEPIACVGQLADLPAAFLVERVLDVSEQGERIGNYYFTERTLAEPYVKDYDAIPNQGPTYWARQFDLTNWIFLGAWRDGRRVGGAVIARDTSGVDMLEGRRDLAVLWDIRVAPEVRGRGVGAALFRGVETAAWRCGCHEIKVETQNNNVPACRFYAKQGCRLHHVVAGAYREFPNEVQLLWRKHLSG